MEKRKTFKNQVFIGRSAELSRLRDVEKSDEAQSLIIYGRRRVGKTALIEEAFSKRQLLKFEGIENAEEHRQRQHVMRQLSHYANQPLLEKVEVTTWVDVFDHIYTYTKQGIWTVYFEEVQWLANYKNDFINELKYAWDNQFRHNPHLILILCGSAPAFMVNQVIHSKSFYNRSQTEIHVREFSLNETKQLLGNKSHREIMNAYLTIGGVPEYLKKIKYGSSVFTNLCKQSFLPESYFSREYERIFISSLRENPYYRKIIEFLSKKRFATREEIALDLKQSSGGRLTDYLNELELCGFIIKYTPYNLASTSKLARYHISDAYLQFFFKFIKPKLNDIESGKYQSLPTHAIKTDDYQQWLEYSFERYCRSHSHDIAKLLGFSGVNYRSGAFYNRATSKENPGYQIDLLFDREDQVITVCEIKYLQTAVGTKVIDSFAKKLAGLENKKKKTIHKVLISAEGAEQALIDRGYFDEVITLDDFFRIH